MIDKVNVCSHFSFSEHNVLNWTTNVVVKRETNSRPVREFTRRRRRRRELTGAG